MKLPKYTDIHRATIVFFLLVVFFFLPSCAGIGAGITGTPIPATAVQRSGQPAAPIILVASQDLALAEQAPIGTVHGLYNASALAAHLRDARGKSSK